jgi:RNA recognition motif-containing protein
MQQVINFYLYFFMNIYVGNLSYRVRDIDLQQTFEEFGPVSSAKVIMERGSNRSKGFGFVEMDNDSDAKNAIDYLNGREFQGRSMVAKEALPRK